jgi:HAD superfamily hydrolase (TIGR01509 family)
MKTYLEFYRDQHERLAGVHEGMDSLVRELRAQGVTLAVFTGKGTHTTRITLEAIGLTGLFHVVVTGNDVERFKPSGEGIRNILAATKTPPEQALMVGDSLSDVKAARDAGVAVASVLWNAYAPDDVLAAHPDHVFYAVPEFAAWIREHV